MLERLMELYIGSLSWSVTEEALKKLFSQFGDVEKIFIPWDRDRERPKGFAFITMPDSEAAAKAIGALNGTDFCGRTLRVSKGLRDRSWS
jgi:RNA recognition motif-containing protein